MSYPFRTMWVGRRRCGREGEQTMDKRQSSEPVPAVGAELATIMESLAAGEGAAIHWLIEAHRADLARTVRAIASARKRSLNAELVDELVLEAALAVREVAGAWRPDGAPPWVWARGRIQAAVDRCLGLFGDELDPERMETEVAPAPPAHEEETSVYLKRLAASVPEVHLLCEGLSRVASPRDQALFVEVGIQSVMGDPSPAVTVGAIYGMNPASVRQQSRRTRLRLRQLADTEPRFRALAEMALVS